jgi:hypothetical protein
MGEQWSLSETSDARRAWPRSDANGPGRPRAPRRGLDEGLPSFRTAISRSDRDSPYKREWRGLLNRTALVGAAKSGAPLERTKGMNRPFDNRPHFCH